MRSLQSCHTCIKNGETSSESASYLLQVVIISATSPFSAIGIDCTASFFPNNVSQSTSWLTQIVQMVTGRVCFL